MISSLFGQKIFVADVTITTEDQVKRTWRQRWSSVDLDPGPWFSRPWRPWQKTRTETRREPAMFQTPYGWIVHPTMMNELEKFLGESLT